MFETAFLGTWRNFGSPCFHHVWQGGVRNMRMRYFAVLLAVLLCALPLAAQEQSGSIDGVVKDAQGAPVAGATVVAKSSRGMSLESVTDTTGTYRFPSVPPGRYEITANLTGFAPGKVEANVTLGTTATANVTLKVGAMTETVQVTAEAPIIDVKSSSRATNLRDEAIDKMPKGRDYT